MWKRCKCLKQCFSDQKMTHDKCVSFKPSAKIGLKSRFMLCAESQCEKQCEKTGNKTSNEKRIPIQFKAMKGKRSSSVCISSSILYRSGMPFASDYLMASKINTSRTSICWHFTRSNGKPIAYATLSSVHCTCRRIGFVDMLYSISWCSNSIKRGLSAFLTSLVILKHAKESPYQFLFNQSNKIPLFSTIIRFFFHSSLALHLQSNIVIPCRFRTDKITNWKPNRPTNQLIFKSIHSGVYWVQFMAMQTVKHSQYTKSSHSRNVFCNDDNSSSLVRKLCVLSKSEYDAIVRSDRNGWGSAWNGEHANSLHN